MGRLFSVLIGIVVLGLSGCAGPRLHSTAGTDVEVAAAPVQDPTIELVCCNGRHPAWDDPRGVVLTAEEGRLPACCCEEEEEECKRHEVVLFLGYSTERGEGGGGTVGLEYSYKLTSRWTVAAFAEHVAGDLDAGAAGVGAAFWPVDWLWLFAGPGFEVVERTEEEQHEGELNVNFMFRFGAGVHIELGKGWFISPSVYYDLLNPFEKRAASTPVFIYGLNFGREF